MYFDQWQPNRSTPYLPTNWYDYKPLHVLIIERVQCWKSVCGIIKCQIVEYTSFVYTKVEYRTEVRNWVYNIIPFSDGNYQVLRLSHLVYFNFYYFSETILCTGILVYHMLGTFIVLKLFSLKKQILILFILTCSIFFFFQKTDALHFRIFLYTQDTSIQAARHLNLDGIVCFVV